MISSRRALGPLAVSLWIAVAAILPSRAAAEAEGGVVEAGAAPHAEGYARGPLIDAHPALAPCLSCSRTCSFRHPLCVDAGRGTRGAVALATLAAADRAWDAVTGAIGAPAPDGGLDGIWHIELTDGVDGGAEALMRDRDLVSHFDRASSFARVDRSLSPGCALDLALARAVARGSQWRAAPATDEASAKAESEAMARLATPCAGANADTDAFEAHPERALVDSASPAGERGASLFFGWLDRTFGAQPGSLLVCLWALAPTRTPWSAERWAAAPTGFDVLRQSLKNALWDGSTLDDVIVRFGVARASMVPPARLAWHIAWPAQPRRLASPVSVAPTGASYVLVDRTGAAAGAKLRVEAEWEDYGRMRWVVVKLDAASHTVAEVPITSLDRTPHASMTIESLEGTERVLIVGVNVGSTERPFDPGEGEWEPHGWLLTVGAE